MYPQELTRARRLLFEAFQQVGKDSINMLRNDQVLPLLCSVAIKQGATKQHIMDMLHHVEEQTQDANVLRIIARCMVAIGELDEAHVIWKQIVTHISDAALHQEFVDFLCYVAVLEYKSERHIRAIRLLDEAKQYLPDSDQKIRLKKLTSFLRLQDACNRFLTAQFARSPVPYQALGRFHMVQRIILETPELKRCLLNTKDKKQIQHVWARVNIADDPQFLHIRAVTYRNVALASLTQHELAENYFIISTALWLLLLSSPQFWHYFSLERWFDKQGNRIDLMDWQQEDVRHKAVHSILSLHIEQASRAFTEGEYGKAQFHFQRLYDCSRGKKILLDTLKRCNMLFTLDVADEQIQRVQIEAEKILGEWTRSFTKYAEKQMAHSVLPSGLRKHYRVGIDALSPFLQLSAPDTHIFTTCLEWYSDWCRDIWPDNFQTVCNLVKEASPVADKLIPLASKGNGYKPENQALSWHFLWRYLVVREKQEQERALREAYAWNPSNSSVQKFLSQEHINVR